MNLRVGDLVSDDRGALGKVVKFTRDHAVVHWDGDACACGYTDDELKARGVVLVDGQ